MKMKFWILLAMSVASFSLAGCKEHVRIFNGELPENLVGPAEKLMGQYDGKLQGRPVTLNISLDGKKVLVTSGNDILDPACGAIVGELREVYVKNKKGSGSLSTAIFAFDAGKCSSDIWGRELSLSFKEKGGQIKASAHIYGGSQSHWECGVYGSYPGHYPGYYPGHPGYYPPGHPGAGYYPPGYYPPAHACRWVTDHWYLNGSFKKTN